MSEAQLRQCSTCKLLQVLHCSQMGEGAPEGGAREQVTVTAPMGEQSEVIGAITVACEGGAGV